ncbi:hypothetical protein MTR67_023743 [Solanum verrucosum]|uniref:Uncharacterized protein n=1 Tax=Solanum verrucosum TaxID=315347 RepID=A0AAF0QW78_SOLVR|nr:hypothetical protein MTR67_023743 [Solanum verrucosum]
MRYLSWHAHSGTIKFVMQNSFKIFGRMVLELMSVKMVSWKEMSSINVSRLRWEAAKKGKN